MERDGMPGGRGPAPIPQRRVAEKLNEYMSRRDYAGVERHLRYWLAEAQAGCDRRGELMVRNEMVGHYRKTREREKAYESAEAALRMLDELGYSGSISEGTTCVNVATMYQSFDDNDAALQLFRRARSAYEHSAGTDDALLGGLYNNMGLACAALGRWNEALGLYDLAMARMANVPNGALEQAVTCLNRADALAGRDGAEAAEHAVFDLLDQAAALLDRDDLPRDGYYAYLCAHCAPAFEYHGFFAEADLLRKRSEEIYERNDALPDLL